MEDVGVTALFILPPNRNFLVKPPALICLGGQSSIRAETECVKV